MKKSNPLGTSIRNKHPRIVLTCHLSAYPLLKKKNLYNEFSQNSNIYLINGNVTCAQDFKFLIVTANCLIRYCTSFTRVLLLLHVNHFRFQQ